MARPSKVDRLPAEIRDVIRGLREDGRTIDEIMAKLRELDADVGRSGLGDYIKRFDTMRQRLHHSRAASEAIMARLEDAGAEDRVARFNIAALHAGVMELMAGEDGEAVTLDPKSAKLISETLRNLATAAKSDQDKLFAHKKWLVEQARKVMAEVASEAKAAGRPVDPMEVIRRIRENYGIYEE